MNGIIVVRMKLWMKVIKVVFFFLNFVIIGRVVFMVVVLFMIMVFFGDIYFMIIGYRIIVRIFFNRLFKNLIVLQIVEYWVISGLVIEYYLYFVFIVSFYFRFILSINVLIVLLRRDFKSVFVGRRRDFFFEFFQFFCVEVYFQIDFYEEYKEIEYNFVGVFKIWIEEMFDEQFEDKRFEYKVEKF